jgi:serine/threonine protein kinase
MPADARVRWLNALQERDPVMAADLRRLLDQHAAVARDRFLEDGPEQLAATSELTGQSVGAYTIAGPIGRGGMGTVWRAELNDGRFDRAAAIKFLNIGLIGRHGEARFTREGRILARLAHPHIAQLIDAGVSDSGQPYLVLEHVDGEPIDRYCDRRGLDVNARVRLFLDVLAAVAHAHANLVVHRDIKPSNVLVAADGQVKLLDFGVAKLLEDMTDGEAMTALTRDGAAAMTPLYAAPEQITDAPITIATDVYALGLLLYVLLAGRHPVGDTVRSAADVVKAVLEREPPRISESGRPIPRDLETIVAKALKKNPEERYRSVPAFSEDLQRFLRHEPILARPDTIAYRTAKFVRRNRVPVAAGILTFAALSAGLYVVNRERGIAERRFRDVRQLANKLLDLDVQVRQLPGGTKTRQMIVDTSLDYLRRLGVEATKDPDLALEIGTA